MVEGQINQMLTIDQDEINIKYSDYMHCILFVSQKQKMSFKPDPNFI